MDEIQKQLSREHHKHYFSYLLNSKILGLNSDTNCDCECG